MTADLRGGNFRETGNFNNYEVLTGKKEISEFVGRGWRTISRWIAERNFPATKIDGRWESDTDLIRQWRKKQIAKERGN